MAAIILQAVLGILTLLHQVPIDLALAHQAVAIVVLTLAVLQTERLVARRVDARPAETGSAARPARLKLSNSNLPPFREVLDLQGFPAARRF